MTHLHLVIGPVAAGKSTFALRLAEERGAVRLTLDDWMAQLYGEDQRPREGRLDWYAERVERCLGLIWNLTRDLMARGTEVILEVGLIQRMARLDFYSRIDAEAYDHTVYVVDADRAVRRERVLRRNREKGETHHVHVPLEFFELASDRWEPPTPEEMADRNVRFVD